MARNCRTSLPRPAAAAIRRSTLAVPSHLCRPAARTHRPSGHPRLPPTSVAGSSCLDKHGEQMPGAKKLSRLQVDSAAGGLPALWASFAPEAIEFGAHPWTARHVAGRLLPGVDRTLARLIADPDDRVRSLAHTRAQASADPGV